MNSRKRLREEFESLTAITSPNKAAKVHGRVTKLSPMKTSSRNFKYFDGQLADGTASMRIFGFNNDAHQKMATHYQEKNPIVLDNCQIQKSKFGESMEVFVDVTTNITESPKQFTSVDISAGTNIITLNQLPVLTKFQTVTVSVKVLKAKERTEVKCGLWMQDVTVSDPSGTARLTLWQNDIGILDEGKSYQLQDVLVHSFCNTNYLSPPRTGFSFSPIEDLGEDADAPEHQRNVIDNAVVASVSNLTRGSFCISPNCHGKVTPTNGLIGSCTICSAAQRMDKCRKSVSATLLISPGGQTHLHLQASFLMMKAIADDIKDDSSDGEIVESILMASPFTLTFAADKNILSVYRQ